MDFFHKKIRTEPRKGAALGVKYKYAKNYIFTARLYSI